MLCLPFDPSWSGPVPAVLRPVIPIQTPVLDRFGEVLGGDRGGLIEICHRAGDLEDAIVGARGEAHPPHRHFQRALAGIVERERNMHEWYYLTSS